MNLQDYLALFTFAFAIAGVVFALGKQSQGLTTVGDDVNNVGKKLEGHIYRSDKRIDELTNFTVRVDQRLANLERQVYGDNITQILRSGRGFRLGEDDDTKPDL